MRSCLRVKLIGSLLKKILALSGCFVLVLVCQLLKPTVVSCGSVSYWTFVVAPLLVIFSFTLVVIRYLMRKSEFRRVVGAPTVEGDVEWNKQPIIVSPLICPLAGLFAGMF